MITNIRNRTMNLIYCYINITFMLIVNVHSDVFGSYRCIMDEHGNNTVTSNSEYLNYASSSYPYPKFNQQLLEPEDFYLSFYNPHYFFFFKYNVDNYSQFKSARTKNLTLAYNGIKEKEFSLISNPKDINLIGVCPNYWHKRPEFYDLNTKIAKLFSVYKSMYIYANDSTEFVGNEVVRQIEGSAKNADKNPNPLLDIKDVMMLDKVTLSNPIDISVDPNFYEINEKEFKALVILTNLLPKNEESIHHYLNRHYETVQALLYLNKAVVNFMNKNGDVKKMSRDRVQSLSSPYLLRYESYNVYVLRLKNMNMIPFHIGFFQKKLNLFKDQNKKTIFEELRVNFR